MFPPKFVSLNLDLKRNVKHLFSQFLQIQCWHITLGSPYRRGWFHGLYLICLIPPSLLLTFERMPYKESKRRGNRSESTENVFSRMMFSFVQINTLPNNVLVQYLLYGNKELPGNVNKNFLELTLNFIQ